MKEKIKRFLRATEELVRAKYQAQDHIFLTIEQYKDGLITYEECQYIVYTYMQGIHGVFLREFKADRFF